MFVPNLAEIIH